MYQRNETSSFTVQIPYLNTVEKMKQNSSLFSDKVTGSLVVHNQGI